MFTNIEHPNMLGLYIHIYTRVNSVASLAHANSLSSSLVFLTTYPTTLILPVRRLSDLLSLVIESHYRFPYYLPLPYVYVYIKGS
jgi:hypothetical protein